jgi:hypothetical protein
MLFDMDDEKIFFRYSVPLLLHVPEKYLYKSDADTTRWGSHKDIFPTIYNLALDSAVYFNNGNNLLERTTERKKYFALNIMGGAAISDDGAVRYNYDQKFRPAGNQLYEPVNGADSSLDVLLRRSKAYFAMMAFHLKEEVERHHSKTFGK